MIMDGLIIDSDNRLLIDTVSNPIDCINELLIDYQSFINQISYKELITNTQNFFRVDYLLIIGHSLQRGQDPLPFRKERERSNPINLVSMCPIPGQLPILVQRNYGTYQAC